MRRYQSNAKTGLTLIMPAFVFAFAFLVYPVINMAYMSLFDYSPLKSPVPTFVGLANYKWLITSDAVRHSVWVTILFTVISVSIEMFLGIAIAEPLSKLMLRAQTRFSRFTSKLCSGILILPFAAPAVAAAVSWKILLHPQFGPVNAVLGVEIPWFTEHPLASVILVDAWKMTPMVTFLLLAAIMSADPAQYEAAKIDGASAWQEFWFLTLPSILPVIGVTAAFRAVDAFTKVFDVVYMTTGGGPGYATEVFPLLVWKTAFTHLRFGQASALAVVAILISALLGSLLIPRRDST